MSLFQGVPTAVRSILHLQDQILWNFREITVVSFTLRPL